MVDRTEREVEDTVVFGIRWDGGRRPRNGRKWLAAAVAVVLASLAPATAQAMPLHAPAPALDTAVVVPAAGQDAGARALVARLGGHAGRRLPLIGGFAARVPAGALARLKASPLVRTASPNVSLSVRDDGSSDAATSMAIVRGASGAQAIQDAGGDGSGVGIAVVDSASCRAGPRQRPGRPRPRLLRRSRQLGPARSRHLRPRHPPGRRDRRPRRRRRGRRPRCAPGQRQGRRRRRPDQPR